MNALIAKARTATTEQLMEMSMVLDGASTKEAAMSRMAVMVALEERVGSEVFNSFCDELEAQ
jgi:hypothetical protein